MIRNITKKGFNLQWHLQRFAFGGGHAKAFDWRDDHDLNPFYELDPRRAGLPDPKTYEYPHVSEPNRYTNPYPSNYNPKDLTQTFVGTYPLQSVGETNLVEAPEQVILDDIQHEWDCES